MNILKSFTIWFLRVLCVTAISGMVYLVTLSTTVFDRSEVKQWLSVSGTYDNNTLVSALFSASTVELADTGIRDETLVSSESVTRAAERTFDKTFLKTSFETVINTSYDWVEGKQPSLRFSIPLNAKHDTFFAELAKEIEPKVAALPVCNVAPQNLCRPASMSSPAFTQQAINGAINRSDFLEKPLTEATFASAVQQQDSGVLQQIPRLRSLVNVLLTTLPFVILLSALGAAFLTARGSRMKLFMKLSREVFSSMFLAILIAGGVLILQHYNIPPLEQLFSKAGPLTPLMATFINHLIGDVAWALLLYAGISLIISLTVWVTLRIIKNQQPKESVALASVSTPREPLL